MDLIRNSSRLILLVLLLSMVAGGCKSKKKAMEAAAAAEKTRIEKEEADRKKEEERRRLEEEERAKREAALGGTESKAPEAKLNQYFAAIASSANPASANQSINEALSMFASPDTPVLIVISESGGLKDYDRPTTIREYLHYLKDQKKNINTISSIKVNDAGKITEVELRKSL
jgi:hypothetical protein